ncbi:hypothetical protein ANN_02508 [Periplaneta americana]|uniref:Uncharacterized protein n=1 Tax=Periplaneta americana TaxID=6978 RepID=A0ABQ8TY50_PERAM|nr:hypothetical protein ANN_02508 [Periplaneta americana]
MEVIDALDSTVSSAVAPVKSLPSEQLLEDILFIDSDFKIVSKSITLLESIGSTLMHPQAAASKQALVIEYSLENHPSTESLQSSFSSDTDRARCLALQQNVSGSSLHAIPSPNIGILMGPRSFKVSVALRLGCKICHIHKCICGNIVDSYGHHALSCVMSKGRLSRHSSLNDIIKRALTSSGFPSILDPSGISRSDGKRPDGLTLVPWRVGKSLIWDSTCVDTLVPSHLSSTSKTPGSAAESAAVIKQTHININILQIIIFLSLCGLKRLDHGVVKPKLSSPP